MIVCRLRNKRLSVDKSTLGTELASSSMVRRDEKVSGHGSKKISLVWACKWWQVEQGVGEGGGEGEGVVDKVDGDVWVDKGASLGKDGRMKGKLGWRFHVGSRMKG